MFNFDGSPEEMIELVLYSLYSHPIKGLANNGMAIHDGLLLLF